MQDILNENCELLYKLIDKSNLKKNKKYRTTSLTAVKINSLICNFILSNIQSTYIMYVNSTYLSY